jgi:hypothetical protein
LTVLRVKVTREPSGDHIGFVSCVGPSEVCSVTVSFRWFEPSTSMT